MLSQLILETQEELAYLEQKLPRLRARLSSFQQLYRDLQLKTREDLDEEDEVGDREALLLLRSLQSKPETLQYLKVSYA